MVNEKSAKQIDVPAMSTALVRIPTAGHYGPMRLSVDFMARANGHLECFLHNNQNISTEAPNGYIWRFENKLKMVLQPRSAFDKTLLSEKELQK